VQDDFQRVSLQIGKQQVRGSYSVVLLENYNTGVRLCCLLPGARVRLGWFGALAWWLTRAPARTISTTINPARGADLEMHPCPS
jgi:hypothetical protein